MDGISSIPDPEQLRELLAAPGSPGIALIDPEGGEAPFYVGLDAAGELTRVDRS